MCEHVSTCVNIVYMCVHDVIISTGTSLEHSALLDSGTEGLEFKDSPHQPPNQLVVVSIDFSDLAGVEHDAIRLFADNTTTAKQV